MIRFRANSKYDIIDLLQYRFVQELFSRFLNKLRLSGPSGTSLRACLFSIQRDWFQSPQEHACVVYRFRHSGLWIVDHCRNGTADKVELDLKTISKQIISEKFDMIILCHYHPHGSTDPSASDLRTTRMVFDICRSFDVILLDHIIYGVQPRFSFRKAGFL